MLLGGMLSDTAVVVRDANDEVVLMWGSNSRGIIGHYPGWKKKGGNRENVAH